MTVPCPICGKPIEPKQDVFISMYGDHWHQVCRKQWERDRLVRSQIRDAMCSHEWTAERAQRELGLTLPVARKKTRR